jgi:hypothetical protein
MKTTSELIQIWNTLPAQEKMAFGTRYITHETDLRAWDKNYEELSPLKQQRVLSAVETFADVNNHCVIGSGISTDTLEKNKFKNGKRDE